MIKMKIAKDYIEITPNEFLEIYNHPPHYFLQWIIKNMEEITGISFNLQKDNNSWTTSTTDQKISNLSK